MKPNETRPILSMLAMPLLALAGGLIAALQAKRSEDRAKQAKAPEPRDRV